MNDRATRRSEAQWAVVAAAGLALGVLAVLAYGARAALDGRGAAQATGALVGALAGVALYHAAFGFTGGWRRFLRERRGLGIRAQCLLIGLTAAATFPLIGYQDLTGWVMHPVVMPMGIASALGAAVFGIGMQLGGGCASGTLFTAGGGSTRMLVTLAAFVAGSVAATAHLHEVWFQLDEALGVPNLRPVSLIGLFGPLGGLAGLLAILAALAGLSAVVERRAHGALETAGDTRSLLRGPWSRSMGAAVLALVGIASFLLYERPWGVTSGFALWGAHVLDGLGIPVRDWGYWQGWRAGQLDRSVLADRISVMNVGILIGAMAAAGLAGRFRPVWRLTGAELATALIGGLLMGYGARLAFGCNIGALLGGLVSGSLHGLWWLAFGFAGSAIGVWLRARLGIDPSARQPRPA